MEDDEDEEMEVAFAWTTMHELHAYAWRAASGYLDGVGIVLGLNLIDAIKTEAIDDVGAKPYIDILRDADINERAPRWD